MDSSELSEYSCGRDPVWGGKWDRASGRNDQTSLCFSFKLLLWASSYSDKMHTNHERGKEKKSHHSYGDVLSTAISSSSFRITTDNYNLPVAEMKRFRLLLRVWY